MLPNSVYPMKGGKVCRPRQIQRLVHSYSPFLRLLRISSAIERIPASSRCFCLSHFPRHVQDGLLGGHLWRGSLSRDATLECQLAAFAQKHRSLPCGTARKRRKRSSVGKSASGILHQTALYGWYNRKPLSDGRSCGSVEGRETSRFQSSEPLSTLARSFLVLVRIGTAKR